MNDGPTGNITKPLDPTYEYKSNTKITIFGAGKVGMACGFTLLLQKITNHIVYITKTENEIKQDVLDLQYCSGMYSNAVVEATTSDYSKMANSRICIMAAGGRIPPGENKIDVLQKNVEILRGIVPQIVRYCPECIIIVVTSPVDIISYFAWKMSHFPANRVFGTGHLYSKIFQYEIAKHLKLNTNIIHAQIVGEYGDSGVCVWSSVNVAGTRLQDINKDFGTTKDPDRSFELHKELLNIPHKINVLKGYTSWSPGLCVAAIINSIFNNSNEIFSVSVLAKGIAKIEKTIFLALPCEIGCHGPLRCVVPRFNEAERKKFEKSADVIDKKLKKCTFWTVNSPVL